MPLQKKSPTDDRLRCPICGGLFLKKVRETPYVPYVNDWECMNPECRTIFTYHETPMKRFSDPVWIGKMTEAMQQGSMKPSLMRNPLAFLRRRKRKRRPSLLPYIIKGGKL